MRRSKPCFLGLALLAFTSAGCGSSEPANKPSIPINDPGIEAMKAEMTKNMQTKNYRNFNKAQPNR